MPKTIKTREITHDVKTLDRKAVLDDALRTAQTKTKEAAGQADGSDSDSYRDGGDYAVAQVERTASDGAAAAKDISVRKAENVRDGLRDVRSVRDGLKGSGQTAHGTRQAGSAAREQTAQVILGQRAQTSAAKAPSATRQNAARQATTTGRQAASKRTATRSTPAASEGAAKGAVTKAMATNRQTGAAAKGGIKYGSKGTVKTATHSIKGAQRTVGRVTKTTQRTAHGARATARGARIAARNAAAAARTASRATVTLGSVSGSM
jgi:hypothetical protein